MAMTLAHLIFFIYNFSSKKLTILPKNLLLVMKKSKNNFKLKTHIFEHRNFRKMTLKNFKMLSGMMLYFCGKHPKTQSTVFNENSTSSATTEPSKLGKIPVETKTIIMS